MFQSAECQTINLKGKLLSFDTPKIMGILNLTPDSFFDGGRHQSLDAARLQAEKMLNEGADIIDVGPYSSRPGATAISVQEEIDRAVPVIEMLHREFPDTPLSIDTYRADVAEASIQAGAHIINDISGGLLDEHMFATVAKLQVPYILMHMRGSPATMQTLVDYQDVANDIAVELGHRIAALRALGVHDIILDPGFGFAKTMEQNYELLFRVDEFHYFGLPLLGGVSRKSMLYKKLGLQPADVLPGTIALNTLLLERGVHLLRVHDVKEAKQLINIFFS